MKFPIEDGEDFLAFCGLSFPSADSFPFYREDFVFHVIPLVNF